MINTLLYQLIAHFSLRERQEARKWLISPVHNERKELVRLFDFLEERHHYLKLSPDRKETYAYVFPTQSFNDQQLRLHCSYLYQCLEEWMSWKQWQGERKQADISLLKNYRERGMDKAFARQERKQRALLDQATIRDHNFHWLQYRHEHELYLWQSRKGRAPRFNFEAQDNALQLAVMSYKLRLACLSVAHQNVSGADYQIALLPEVLALAETPEYANIPAISVYYSAYQMFVQIDDDAAFLAFETVLFKYLDCFPEEEKRDLTLLGINFCIRQINKKGDTYFKEALTLYRKGLENKLLLENGWLSAFTYSNITIIAIRSKEIEWVAHFLDHYRKQLAPALRDSIYALNAARLAYHQGKHREALLHLHNFDDRDFFHQLSAKIIQLKIYYEDGDYQLLSAHIKNTRALLRREKRHAYHKQIYSNIFSLTEQLMKLSPYNKKRKETLRQQIENTEPLTERTWLLQQLG